MKAIIPVAGLGTRLLPHTEHIQKCLLPVAGKPILGHIIQSLLDAGIDEITLITGHLGEQVEQYCRSFSDIAFNFINQSERKGLGHAVFQGLSHTSEPVLVMLGDTVFDMDMSRFISTEWANIAVVEVPDPQRFGIIEVKGNRITKFIEKPADPPTNLAIGGGYYFPHQSELYTAVQHLIDHDIRNRGEIQLTDALQLMVDSGIAFGYQEIDHWLDCGLPETILSTNKFILEKQGISYLHSTAEIRDSQLKYCHISSGCSVVNAQLENVIMLENSHVKNVRLTNQIVGVSEEIG